MRNSSARCCFAMLASAIFAWPAVAAACSGPGAVEAIRISGFIALGSFVLTLLWLLTTLVVPWLRRRIGRIGLWALTAATVFHPGLLLSTMSGDCGYTARFASLAFLPVLALGSVWLLWRGQRRLSPAT